MRLASFKSNWAGIVGFSIGLAFVALVQTHAENWPWFRGPTRQGISLEKDPPLHWSASSNILWKTSLPGEGWSSPIVYGDRVFVTAATDQGAGCHVLCLDRNTGSVLWDKEVLRQTVKHKESKNSYATPTPATDGERVFAVFCDGSVVCLDNQGKALWTNRDFPFYSQHGLGASPILYEDLLIMAYDGSQEETDKAAGWQKPWDKAVVVAFDQKTGRVRWQGRRGMSRISHVTPAILQRPEGDQLISGAGDVVQGFDPKTGHLIWTLRNEGEGVVPSIVLGRDLVFAASGFPHKIIRAIKSGGKGEIPESNIAWEHQKDVPTMSSFLYLAPHLFTINEAGIAQCLMEDTGEVVWRQRLPGHFSASPVCVDGHLFFLSEEGETIIVAARSDYREIARNSLGERCQASMAVSRQSLFIRTERHLFCVAREKP